MSPSSDESKRSFASSKSRGSGFSEALRALSESRGLGALQRSLRIAFVAFAAAIVAFACLGDGGTILQRLAAAIVPALGAMSIVLLFALAGELARAFDLDPFAMSVAAAVAFACSFSSLRPAESGVAASFRTLGSSGIFLAILIGFAVAAAALGLRRAGLAPAAATWSAGIGVALVFAANCGRRDFRLRAFGCVAASARRLGRQLRGTSDDRAGRNAALDDRNSRPRAAGRGSDARSTSRSRAKTPRHSRTAFRFRTSSRSRRFSSSFRAARARRSHSSS